MFEVQHGQTKIQFEGEKIAFVSAELPSKTRWTEFEVYLSVHSEWVLQGIGRSRVPGEIDRFWIVMSRDPLDVLNAIIGRDASLLAKKLLSQTLSYLADCDTLEVASS